MAKAIQMIYQPSEIFYGMEDIVGDRAVRLAEFMRFMQSDTIVPAFFAVRLKEKKVLKDDLLLDAASLLHPKAKLGDVDSPLLLAIRQSTIPGGHKDSSSVVGVGVSVGTSENSILKNLNEILHDERASIMLYFRLLTSIAANSHSLNRKVQSRIITSLQAAGVSSVSDLSLHNLGHLSKAIDTMIPDKVTDSAQSQYLTSVKSLRNEDNGVIVQRYIPVGIVMTGSGTAFSRHRMTGEPIVGGMYLFSGTRDEIRDGSSIPMSIYNGLRNLKPGLYEKIETIARKAEDFLGDIAEVDFVIAGRQVYVIDIRPSRRSSMVHLSTLLKKYHAQKITAYDLIAQVDASHLALEMMPSIQNPNNFKPILTGMAASSGAASGIVAHTPAQATEAYKNGTPYVYMRVNTYPSDFVYEEHAVAIVTASGGMTCHAAVIARQLGKPCVIIPDGFSVLEAGILYKDEEGKTHDLSGGAEITVDGSSGCVYDVTLNVENPDINDFPDIKELLEVADSVADMPVMANAETVQQIAVALAAGAKGIGLCRTEHMFVGEVTVALQNYLLADQPKIVQGALDKIVEIQTQDFVGIFKKLENLPIVIRLLDPPLHEFLPKIEDLHEASSLIPIIQSMQEVNPMMGLRGVRLGILKWDLYRAQVIAICNAWKLMSEPPRVKIMVPLVSSVGEMSYIYDLIFGELQVLGLESHMEIGAMIETPRAALMAKELSEYAEFFSFGTNDLTQMTYGMSRDDAEAHYIAAYEDLGVIVPGSNPFTTLDDAGVGELIRIARNSAPDISMGICGEHGAELRSIMLCQQYGINYVSASPGSILKARLYVAKAAVEFPTSEELKGGEES